MLHPRDRRDHDPAFARLLASLNDGALRAVDELGWTATVHAAAESGVAEAVAVARSADMVLVMGGEDVHPDFYGGPRDHPGSGVHEPAADEAQLAVVRAERASPGDRRLGDGLRVVAAGEDGIVEAVVHERAPITGVQWHPEHLDATAGQLTRLLRRLESQLG